MDSIPKLNFKQKARENDIPRECAGYSVIPQTIGEKYSGTKLNKNGSGDCRDRGITKTMLARIPKHWQATGWVDVSHIPGGTVTRWRNYR